jgi:FKBP-type peptidyl-prolyl cis-trans isomerase
MLKFAIISLLLLAPLVLIGGDRSDDGPTKVQGDPVSLGGGLQYWDIKVGKGAPAISGKRVRVHYSGWLESGRKFDSSYDSGRPIVFPLGRGQVIEGWDRGLVGMREGGKRQLRIPPRLGYGSAGSPPVVPGNATLIFDIEMLAVER